MGSSESKLAEKSPESTNLAEQESIPSTPILTPQLFRKTTDKNGLDPRSPSKHIARTPIELLSAAADKLEKLTLNNEDATTPKETPFKKHIVLGVDPRSPTVEIQRTPIIVNALPDEKSLKKIRNKNLEKVLKCALVNTPQNKSVPPKLLESSPVTARPKSDVYKRKSLVLLETNIDFTETNLDDVIKKKYLGKSLQNLSLSDEIAYKVTDPRSPTIEFLRTPIQICQKVDIATKVEADRELLMQNERDDIKELYNSQSEPIPVTGPPNLETILPINEDCMTKEVTEKQIVDQDLILLVSQGFEGPQEETKHNLMTEDTLAEPLLECTHEKVEEVIKSTSCTKLSPSAKKQTVVPSPILKQKPHLIKSAPVSPPSVVSITPKKSKSQPITPPLINLTADVKELDKKLTHLIYEDEDLVVCPRVVKIKEQNRTPLGLRNGNDNKKSTQKLKVSDKPRKAEYVVSKIPVFKDKKIKVQCENTPPRGMRGSTNKSSKWDAKDDTLVI